MNFLACDLGGTKVLLGIFEKEINNNSPKLIFKKKYISSDWSSFELILEDFLKKECKNITHPSSACFAVAGPLSNNNAKIINLSWNISGNDLQNKFNFKSCELINDFAVQIYGIPFLKKNQYSTIQNGSDSEGTNNDLHAIVGAGTGLGIARGIISGEKVKVLASEGGHVEYSPKSASKHFKNFKSDLFLKQFFDKGRLKDILKTIPMKVILDEEFGLFSAACRAKMLLKT